MMQTHKARHEFGSPADKAADPYLVRMEEVGEGSFVVYYGPASSLQVYPAAATMMALEAVQFLGRLWGAGNIPASLREDYKAWLTRIELELLNHRGTST